MTEILYPDEGNESVQRHSSIDQFDGFLSVWKQGGWSPIVFDTLDGIGACSGLKTHPVIIDLFGDSLGYIFPEKKCVYFSDHFITVDKNGVEYKQLPACFGGDGELIPIYVDKESFIDFDSDDSLGVHNEYALRTGLGYVKSSENLPAGD